MMAKLSVEKEEKHTALYTRVKRSNKAWFHRFADSKGKSASKVMDELIERLRQMNSKVK